MRLDGFFINQGASSRGGGSERDAPARRAAPRARRAPPRRPDPCGEAPLRVAPSRPASGRPRPVGNWHVPCSGPCLPPHAPSPATRFLCYAQHNPDLRAAHCRDDRCNYVALMAHWENTGRAEGRLIDCATVGRKSRAVS